MQEKTLLHCNYCKYFLLFINWCLLDICFLQICAKQHIWLWKKLRLAMTLHMRVSHASLIIIMISGIGVSLASHLIMLDSTTNRMDLRCLIWFFFMFVIQCRCLALYSIFHTLFAQNTDQKLSQVTRAGTIQSAADLIPIQNKPGRYDTYSRRMYKGFQNKEFRISTSK